MSPRTFIIAEAGVNHNGDVARALDLVDVAAESGADAVKFQTFTADRLTRRGAEKAAYQKDATGDGDQYDMLKALEMSARMHEQILLHCQRRRIEFMSTAFDEASFDYLVSLGIKRAKIPSGEITNLNFLRHIARSGLPIILSTGMADLQEVRNAQAAIAGAADGLSSLTVLHCTSSYPAAPQDVNLKAMLTIAHELGVSVGYSDHSLGIGISVAAVALGAELIEKHFTLDKDLPGPDHRASLDPTELTSLIREIRNVEVCLGDGKKIPRPCEIPVRALVRKSVTTIREIQAGEVVDRSALAVLRPGDGIAPSDIELVEGRRAARKLQAGETLHWRDLA